MTTERARENLELGSRFYTAIFSGDWETFASCISDDFVVVEAAGLPYGGTWRGLKGFQELFSALATEHFEGLDLQQKTMTANDDYVMAYFTLSGTVRATGRPLLMEIAEVTEVRKGKVAKVQPFYFDTLAVAAAFRA